MLESIRLIDETLMSTRLSGWTTGELSMLLDIYNGTMLSIAALDRQTLTMEVEDSFNLYPGTYEEKWGTEKQIMLDKISKLSDVRAALLQIWAVDFWKSGAYADTDAINRYITGKLSSGTILASALKTVEEAKALCDQFKHTGVKSKLIAQAVGKCEEAIKLLKELLN